MASNLAYIGLAVDDAVALSKLIAGLMPSTVPIGVGVNGIAVRRWDDPSGSRLVFTVRGREDIDLLPSFAGPLSAQLAEVTPAAETFAMADVVDEKGVMGTRLQLALEELSFLELHRGPVAGSACMTALGNDVALFESKEAFEESRQSLLEPDAEPGPPPPHFVERGLKWPVRVGAESFISTAAFGGSGANARLYGTVLASDRRSVVATGQTFLATTVRTVGFEATVCVPEDDLAIEPRPGNILGGFVYMVASIPSLVPVPSQMRAKRWAPWRRH